MRRILLIFILSFQSIISFCQVKDIVPCRFGATTIASPTPGPEDFIVIENSNRRSDSLDILNYEIHIDVSNYASKYIDAFTKVSFKTKLDKINSITLDLKDLQVDSVFFRGQKINYSYNDSIILAHFDTELNKGQFESVTVYYHGNPTRDLVWGGMYFEQDYIYNLGIGLSTTPPNFGKVWFPCFDNFVERSTFDYYVTTAQDKKAYCVGTFISEEIRPDKKILRHYSMQDPITTYLSNIAAANYAVFKKVHTGRYRNIPFELIAKPADIAKMEEQFINLDKAVDCFEFWFGPYRFERVGYVATTVGAMEHPTNVAYPISSVLGSSLNQNERLFAHELGHHWWGDITTLDDARDMWIKEGTAEYSSHLFQEYVYGKDNFTKTVKGNLVDIIKNAVRNDGAFLPLSPMPYSTTYGTHTYRKGAAMLHNLRAYLGDSLFRKTCTMVFDSLYGKSMNAYEFRDFLSVHSGINLDNYFNDYIFNPGYSTFYLDSFHITKNSSIAKLKMHIHQKSYYADHLYHQVPMIISMYDKNYHRVETRQMLNGEFSEIEFDLPDNFEPVMFLLNENNELNLSSIQSNRIIKKTGNPDIAYVDMSLNIASVKDSALLSVSHFLAGPGMSGLASNIARISNRHFWKVQTIGGENIKVTGNLEYNGVDSLSYDFDLLKSGEDSVIFAYRKDWTEPWSEYLYYSKKALSASDNKGFIQFTQLLDGEYALAYGKHINVANKDVINDPTAFTIYPNPATDEIQIAGDELKEIKYIQIMDLFGRQIQTTAVNVQESTKLNIKNLSPAVYNLQFIDHSGTIISNEILQKN